MKNEHLFVIPAAGQAVVTGVVPSSSRSYHIAYPGCGASKKKMAVASPFLPPQLDKPTPVAPVAYQVILEPGMGQFRAPPSAYSYNFVGTLSCARIDLRKARGRELATLDEKSTTSGIAEPYAR